MHLELFQAFLHFLGLAHECFVLGKCLFGLVHDDLLHAFVDDSESSGGFFALFDAGDDVEVGLFLGDAEYAVVKKTPALFG